MPENSGGWGSLYNSGTGIQGGFGGTSTEYATWAALLSAIQADDNNADNSPKIYVYTGPDITLAENEVVNITGLNRKTIYANAGQTISRGELRHVQCSDIIWRNWKRRGPYVHVDDQPPAKTDYFTFNECHGYWLDYIDMDNEFQYAGAGDMYSDGMIDTTQSDHIVISNCRIWNGQRGMLIGYSNTETANVGLLNTTFRNNWVKNIGGRGPKCRFGKVHLLNNYIGNDPSWFVDWSPLNKPSGQHFGAHGAQAQLYAQNNYNEEGQSLYRDDDPTPYTSGLLIDGDFIGNFQYSGGTVSKRPENVTWNPNTEPGYTYPVPLMTPSNAKSYAEKWAGANYHLIRALTLSETGNGSTSEISSGPYKDGDSVEVLATADSGWYFARWEVDSVEVSTNASYTFTIGADDVSLVAVFETPLVLTLEVDPIGFGTVDQTPASPHDEGTVVSLSATPGAGNKFDGWYDGLTLLSTANPYNYTMPGTNKTITGKFSEITYTLTIQVNNIVAGSIEENTVGPYAEGDPVQVSALANAGYVFGEFASDQITNSGDNPHTFSMPAQNVTVTAMFYPTYDLTLNVNPAGFGTVDTNKDGPYQSGETISLSAVPGSGNQFDGWYDGATLLSTANPYVYTMPSSDKTITGQFSESQLDTYTLTLVIDPVGYGTATQTPTGPHLSGTNVQLLADPGPNRKFLGWYDGVSLLSANNPYTYTTGGTDKTITALFEDGGVIIARRMII